MVPVFGPGFRALNWCRLFITSYDVTKSGAWRQNFVRLSDFFRLFDRVYVKCSKKNLSALMVILWSATPTCTEIIIL